MSPRRARCARRRTRWGTATSCTRTPAHTRLHTSSKPNSPTPSFEFRFSPVDFISWFCFQFRIPQPAHLGNANAEGVEQCLGSCRQRAVDLHGNHAHMPCKVCLRGRGHRHRYLKNVVSHHATKAGCIASWVKEESTSELLLHLPQLGKVHAPKPATLLDIHRP